MNEERRTQNAELRNFSTFCVLRSAFFILLFTACTTTAPPPAQPNPYDSLLDQPPFDRAFWSVQIEDDDGTVLYSRNADKLTIPASNRKLFASATIVNCLGTDGQLVTEIWRDGPDLIIRGDGDPSLGSWRYDRENDFDMLAQSLRGVGVVRDVIADVSAFDRVTIPGGWKHGNLGADYAAPVDALAWGESEIPVDRSVPDAGLYAANALREALELRGIAVTGTTRVNTEPHAWQQRIATLPSPFIADLLRAVLKNSHNLYAEMLLKRAGGGSYDAAFAQERAFLIGDVGVQDGTFQFVDGSGLAPDDLVVPRSTIKLLRWMNDPLRRAFWWSTLAQPANEGTLRRRLVTLESRVRAKTGTINGVNALSGIIDMGDGRYRYFSVMVNHHIADGDEAVKIIDWLVELAASRSAGRTASSPPPPVSH
jgi:D-alanyl-D-alanine carboxypeptidase/D-alanyl-D-alanine-endopeptidase (penicillin-binding protein 4)